tara:strand:- start:1127 stop:1447 length:321 start_codon:yes stop_codon:yes gene_type:complete
MIEIISNAIQNSTVFFLYLFTLGVIIGLIGLSAAGVGLLTMYIPLLECGIVIIVISITIIMIGSYIVNIFNLVEAVYNSRFLEHRKPAFLLIGLVFPPITIYTLLY